MQQCESCSSFIRLTDRENFVLKEKFAKYGYQNADFIGACSRSRTQPTLLFRRFIRKEEYVSDCVLYLREFYKESTGVRCPACGNGEIVILHPRINGHTRVLFGCSNYPSCKPNLYEIQINHTCKFCNTKLTLTCGEILSLTCKRCHRSVEIPVSLKIWPGIAFPGGECSHTKSLSECELCKASREQKRDLIDLEIPAYLNMIQESTSNGANPFHVFTPGITYYPEDFEESMTVDDQDEIDENLLTFASEDDEEDEENESS